jgi:hypothetical protein
MPVIRNLLCFLVSSVSLWIGMSHSLQSIALSSLQNRYARLSCNKNVTYFILPSFVSQTNMGIWPYFWII